MCGICVPCYPCPEVSAFHSRPDTARRSCSHIGDGSGIAHTTALDIHSYSSTYNVKKNGTWPVIIKLFPARENLVSDIPAGDGKTANLFYSVTRVKLLV